MTAAIRFRATPSRRAALGKPTLSTSVERWDSYLGTGTLWRNPTQMKIIREDVRNLFRHCRQLINVCEEELYLIQSACEDEDDESMYAWINECRNTNADDVDAMECENEELAFLKTMPRDKQLPFVKRSLTFFYKWYNAFNGLHDVEEMARDKQLALLRRMWTFAKENSFLH
jgi:hypothetical protein